MSAVETLRADAESLPLVYGDRGFGNEVAARLDALASTLAHVDPAVLDFAAVVAADVAEAPLPDGWTAVVIEPDVLILVNRAEGHEEFATHRRDRWRYAGERFAHLADVVAAVTGGRS